MAMHFLAALLAGDNKEKRDKKIFALGQGFMPCNSLLHYWMDRVYFILF